jgi:hypothetical protein
MAIGWFDSDDMRPLMAGRSIVRVGKEPAQYLTLADALTAIANDQPPVTYPLQHAGRVHILGCVAYVHVDHTSPPANGTWYVRGIEVANGNVTLLGSSFAALATGPIVDVAAVRGGVLKVNRATGGKSYAINCSFTAYTDSTSGSSSAAGLESAASMAFQVHANVAFAAKSGGGSTKPLSDASFAAADFAPGGSVAHLVTPVSGTAGLDGFEGLMIYDTSEDTLKYDDGTGWQTIATAE